MHLPLACWQMSGVYVGSFESRKEQFNRACLVAMGTREKNWHIQNRQNFQSSWTSMVGSIVQHYHRSCPPLGPLHVKSAYQLSEEELHHLAIRVALGQALVDIPVCVHGDNHADSRDHQLPRNRVAGSFRLPLLSSKIRHAQPPKQNTNGW